MSGYSQKTLRVCVCVCMCYHIKNTEGGFNPMGNYFCYYEGNDYRELRLRLARPLIQWFHSAFSP